MLASSDVNFVVINIILRGVVTETKWSLFYDFKIFKSFSKYFIMYMLLKNI